ncbi:unnamed protein product, partial [Iphiclides podalirius]
MDRGRARGAGGRHCGRLGRAGLASRLRDAQHRAAAPRRPRAAATPRPPHPPRPPVASQPAPPRAAPRRAALSTPPATSAAALLTNPTHTRNKVGFTRQMASASTTNLYPSINLFRTAIRVSFLNFTSLFNNTHLYELPLNGARDIIVVRI